MPTPADPVPTALQAAAALIANGRAAEAARELHALVQAAPAYAAAYVLLAKAREASGDTVRALDAWHRAHFLVPSSPLVRRERQRLLDALAPPRPFADEPATAAPSPPKPPAEELVAEAPEAETPEASGAETPTHGTPEDAAAGEGAAPEPEASAPEVTSGNTADGPPPPTDAPQSDGEESAAPKTEPLPVAEAPLVAPLPYAEEDDGLPAAEMDTDEEAWALLEDLPPNGTPAPPTTPVTPDLVAPDAPEAAPPLAPEPEIHDATELPDDSGLDSDLDALIRDLEHAPRITPDPEFSGPSAIANEDEGEEIASETLAKIYAAQGQFGRAADIYDRLARQRPDRAAEMESLAAEMRERAS